MGYENIIDKASILIESLPYINTFYGKTFVIKYGGHAMENSEYQYSFAQDITLLKYVGIRVIIVHGGGPQIDNMFERFGIKSEFKSGMRVTDSSSIDLIEMVLSGNLNKHIVSLIHRAGGKAMGLSGRDANLITADKLYVEDDNGKQIDIGLVGDIKHIDTSIIDLISDRFIPVIAPIGMGTDFKAYNINADIVAGSIASALKAEKLILLTDVDGVQDKSGKRISTIKCSDVQRLKSDQTLTGGMIPKIDCASLAVSNGVKKAHIIDGRVLHSVLLEIFTDSGIGTQVVNQ